MPILGVKGKESCLRTKAEPQTSMFIPQGQHLVGRKLDISPVATHWQVSTWILQGRNCTYLSTFSYQLGS